MSTPTKTGVREANSHIAEMYKKMAALERDYRVRLEKKDEEIENMRSSVAKCELLEVQLKRSEETVAWLNASIHEKNKQIDALARILATIQNALQSADLQPASSPGTVTPKMQQRSNRLEDSGAMSATPPANDSILHGLEVAVPVPGRFSLDSEEDM